jgi:hypothetical protein
MKPLQVNFPAAFVLPNRRIQMLDPVIKSTFLALVVAILTAVVKRFLPDLPISEELINSVALIIVSWIVALLGYEGVLRSAVGKRLQSRGLLPK